MRLLFLLIALFMPLIYMFKKISFLCFLGKAWIMVIKDTRGKILGTQMTLYSLLIL